MMARSRHNVNAVKRKQPSRGRENFLEETTILANTKKKDDKPTDDDDDKRRQARSHWGTATVTTRTP